MAARISHYQCGEVLEHFHCEWLMFSCPSDGLLVSSLQVEVHELFHHRFAFSRDTFVEEKLVLNLGHGGAFDGGRVGDDRVEIELLIVYLLRYSQLLVFFQNL